MKSMSTYVSRFHTGSCNCCSDCFIVFVTYDFSMYNKKIIALSIFKLGASSGFLGVLRRSPPSVTVFSLAFYTDIGSDRIGRRKIRYFSKIGCVANCSSWWSASCAERRRHRAERLLGRVGSDRPAALDPQQLQDLFHRCWRHRVSLLVLLRRKLPHGGHVRLFIFTAEQSWSSRISLHAHAREKKCLTDPSKTCFAQFKPQKPTGGPPRKIQRLR